MKTRALLKIWAALIVLFELGCSQSRFQPEVPTPTQAALSVTISPQSLVMKHGDSWNFVAAVTNAADLAVSWRIQEGATGGAIKRCRSLYVGDMAVARQSHSAALLPNGKVLIVGSGVAELFDPATNALAATGSMSSPYGSTATSLADGRVLVTGQRTNDGSAPASAV